MQLRSSSQVSIAGALSVAMIWATGCPTTSAGIDLSVRGGLVMEITEEPQAGITKITARIRNTLGGPGVLLTSDQMLAVNDSILQTSFFSGITGELSTDVRPQDAYEIVFEDGSLSAAMMLTQQIELDTINTFLGESGLTVTWSPSGGSDVMVEVSIDELRKVLTSDEGTVMLTNDQLDAIEPGAHTLTVRRYRTELISPAFEEMLDSAEVSVGVSRDAAIGL